MNHHESNELFTAQRITRAFTRIWRYSETFGGFHDPHGLGTAAQTCKVNMFVILECRRPRLAWAVAKVFGSHRTAEVPGVSLVSSFVNNGFLWFPHVSTISTVVFQQFQCQLSYSLVTHRHRSPSPKTSRGCRRTSSRVNT